MDILLVIATSAAGLALLIGAAIAVVKLSGELREPPRRWGAILGGSLGLAAMTFLGAAEAAISGVHPITLLIMVYGFVLVLGGMAAGIFAGIIFQLIVGNEDRLRRGSSR